MLKEATYVKLVLLVQLLGCEPGQQLIPQGLERGVQQGVCVAAGRPASGVGSPASAAGAALARFAAGSSSRSSAPTFPQS